MDPSSYYELGRPQDDREQTAFFILDSLLRSRVACGFESQEDTHDESVNVYLVHLLSSLVAAPDLAAAQAAAPSPVTADRDIDVFAQVCDSHDPRFKSLVYRVNADHLLLTSSLFTAMPAHRDRQGRRRIVRGKAYYHYASLFQERLRAASPVFARILRLLSQDFERYVDVLFHMRSEYFHLYERLKEEDLMLPQDDLSAGPDGALLGLDAVRDEFLDAYWSWHQRPDGATREALETAVARLKAVDPGFDFDWPAQ